MPTVTENCPGCRGKLFPHSCEVFYGQLRIGHIMTENMRDSSAAIDLLAYEQQKMVKQVEEELYALGLEAKEWKITITCTPELPVHCVKWENFYGRV